MIMDINFIKDLFGQSIITNLVIISLFLNLDKLIQ